jgi:hypothetical protein
MKTNIGGLDKTLRIILGVSIIIIGASFKSVWGVLGMIPIITAFSGICPFYHLFGINTSPKKQKVR